MIFYFTGTGNSLYAAQKLADEGEKIVSMVGLRLQFCFYAVRLLRALEAFTPLEEALCIFSAESTPTRTWTGSVRG